MFKQCSLCKTEWVSRDSFLRDPEIIIIGYQADFSDLDKGLYLFNHNKYGCKTTLACYVEDFADLYTGAVFAENRFGTENCPGYCLDRKNTKSCPAECRNSYPRMLMQIIKDIRN